MCYIDIMEVLYLTRSIYRVFNFLLYFEAFRLVMIFTILSCVNSFFFGFWKFFLSFILILCLFLTVQKDINSDTDVCLRLLTCGMKKQQGRKLSFCLLVACLFTRVLESGYQLWWGRKELGVGMI